jgi:hypothetical protein
MPIFELYSKRLADSQRAGQSDVYQYDFIPSNLRVQFERIAVASLGKFGAYGDMYINPDENNSLWSQIEKIFLHEKGLYRIADGHLAGERVVEYMRTCGTDDWLDILDLTAYVLRVISERPDIALSRKWAVNVSADNAVDEINYRLRQAGVGFQIEGGRVIRVDSQYIHSEMVKPTLSILSESGFEGPSQEFIAAHTHYRSGQHREAVAMAANALESTFKAIFDQKGWEYKKGARISDLIKVARAHALWPEYLDSSFEQLVATLQSGLPKIRDNDASHGQGSKPKDVPASIAAYALHLSAAKIVFIASCAREMKDD